MSRRELLAGTGALLGAAAVTGAGARAVLGAERGSPSGRTGWGMAVDLGLCASRPGCRGCIDACHSGHRVPALADERHEVKWIWKEPFGRVFPEQLGPWGPPGRAEAPTLVLCNHCEDPPCTRVCPTGATWRRADGVVMMDEHRCIGCRYCMVACPYGARSFGWERGPRVAGASKYPGRDVGVVEKCSLCVERLDAGHLPLCVEACRGLGTPALTFGRLDDAGSPLRRLLASRQVLRRRASLGTRPRVFYLVP